MQDRPDFDYTAECGIKECKECGHVFYPMEVEDDQCPDCGTYGMADYTFKERPDHIIGEVTWLTRTDKAIKTVTMAHCPSGYSMTIKDQDEWDSIVACVNQGIDSHLEALTEQSSFENGQCLIHPEELHVLLRRMGESDNDKAWQLRGDILYTLNLDEV